MPKSVVPPDHEAFDFIGQKLEINDLCVMPVSGYQEVQIGRVVRFTPKMVIMESVPPKKYSNESRAYPTQLVKLDDDQALLYKLKMNG